MGDRHCRRSLVVGFKQLRGRKMRKVLVTVALVFLGLASCLPNGDKPQIHNEVVPEDASDDQLKRRLSELETQVLGQQIPGTTDERISGLETALLGKVASGSEEDRISGLQNAIKQTEKPKTVSLVGVNKAKAEHKPAKKADSPAPAASPKCNKKLHKCDNNPDMECDKDSDCGTVKVAHSAAPAPSVAVSHMRKGCDQKALTCYDDHYQACKTDADCESYKCKKAPSQWIALILSMSPFAPLGAAFAYISRWGLMALYLNATFLPCVLACILVCCFQPKLEDEAYRMPTAVWIMVFWGVLQAILYIWAVWVFGENGFDAGGDFEGCLLRDNWKW